MNNKNYRIKERIKTLFVWRDVSLTGVVKKLNKIKQKETSVSNLSHKLSHETIKFKEVLEICDILGYEVTFKPKSDWKGLE